VSGREDKRRYPDLDKRRIWTTPRAFMFDRHGRTCPMQVPGYEGPMRAYDTQRRGLRFRPRLMQLGFASVL
jgi:hypothetical protein